MAETFDQWALVEIMGHDRYAGRVTEQVIGGCAFVRVDVPEVVSDQLLLDTGKPEVIAPGFSKLFGQGAIFSITPVSEEIARKMAASYRASPIKAFEMPSAPRIGSRFGDGSRNYDDSEDDLYG